MRVCKHPHPELVDRVSFKAWCSYCGSVRKDGIWHGPAVLVTLDRKLSDGAEVIGRFLDARAGDPSTAEGDETRKLAEAWLANR
jgi:hypothetical protein